MTTETTTDDKQPADDADANTEASATTMSNTLTRVTVNLRRQTIEDLDRLAANGCSRTDNINTAIRLAAVVHDIMTRNGGKIVVLMDTGEIERIHIL